MTNTQAKVETMTANVSTESEQEILASARI